MRTIEQSFTVSFRYPVVFTRDAFAPDHPALREALARGGEGPHRVLVVLDANVQAAWPGLMDRIRDWAAAQNGLVAAIEEPFVLPGGEACKTDLGWLPEVLDGIAQREICRHSFVLAVGGGAVLDAAGYAAALAHRGVRMIRMPTTVLAQNDAGIGVKNAVNFRHRKNFIGTFVPPFAVINDFDFLETLDERDRRAGIAEAVKVSLIRDADFFEWLWGQRERLAAFESEAMGEMIVRCAELHLEHIRTGGDPFELGSARPLDFGHWAAHKLEALSGYALRHGEAVAIGIALDVSYARRRGLLGRADGERILELLRSLGLPSSDPALRRLDIADALDEFRVHLGGDLCVCLIDRIGHGIDVDTVDLADMEACVDLLQRRG